MPSPSRSCSRRSTAGSASLPPISRAAAASRSRPCSRRSTTRCAGCARRSTCRRSRRGASSSARSAPRSPRFSPAEIELMPGRVRRLIRPRPSKEIVPGSRLDADEVTETEALIGFVAACRNYASELAINEVTQRTFNELQQFLDTGTRTLLDALRGASGGRASVPPVAGRCRGAVLRQGVRPGIRLAARQGRRGRLARSRAQGRSGRRRLTAKYGVSGLPAADLARPRELCFACPSRDDNPAAMMLWLVLALMTAAAIFAVLWPLARRDAAARRQRRRGLSRPARRDRARPRRRPDRRARGRGRARRGVAAAARGGRRRRRRRRPSAGAPWRRRAAALAALILLPLGAGALYLTLGSPRLAGRAARSAARRAAASSARSRNWSRRSKRIWSRTRTTAAAGRCSRRSICGSAASTTR